MGIDLAVVRVRDHSEFAAGLKECLAHLGKSLLQRVERAKC